MSRVPSPSLGSKKVLVIGGTGETGRRILRTLRTRHPELQLSCAARRADRGEPLPAGISRVGLDMNDEPAAVATLRGFDLAIIALGPMDAFGASPHRLCLQANVDCLDINDSLSAADAIQALDAQARSQGRRILTGMGLTPGLSGLLLMKLVRDAASPSGCYRSRFYAGAAYGGGEASPYVLLDSFAATLTTFTDGRRQTQPAPWNDPHSHFTFPGHEKPLPLIAYSAPEIAALTGSDAASIRSLDYRYSIQFLSPGTARLFGRLSRWPSVRERLAKMFYRSGQSMKKRKKADPDCSLWVYPDDRPQDGWVVHGCVSSYDFTALTACAAACTLLVDNPAVAPGVHSMEQLSADTHQTLLAQLHAYGISPRRAAELDHDRDPLQFGWCQVAVPNAQALPHYSQCWYDASAHPRMQALQTRYLTRSAVWAELRKRCRGPAFIRFVAGFMWRWRQHYRQLNDMRVANTAHAIEWKKITRDISMFTAGYSRVRDLFGERRAYQLYREMFLATGCMEMRWLWPMPEVLAQTENPEQALVEYWQAFMQRYQTLGLLKGQCTENGFRIDQCTFADMFSRLGCPELSPLMRDMEHEALSYLAASTSLEVHWQHQDHGRGQVQLLPRSTALETVAASQLASA